MSDIYKELLNSAESHKTYCPGDKVVLEVQFTDGGKLYCYTADSGQYVPGTPMLVLVDGSYKMVSIVRVHYFDAINYPFYSTHLNRAVSPSTVFSEEPKVKVKQNSKKRAKLVRKSSGRPLENKDQDINKEKKSTENITKENTNKTIVDATTSTTYILDELEDEAYKRAVHKYRVDWIKTIIGFLIVGLVAIFGFTRIKEPRLLISFGIFVCFVLYYIWQVSPLKPIKGKSLSCIQEREWLIKNDPKYSNCEVYKQKDKKIKDHGPKNKYSLHLIGEKVNHRIFGQGVVISIIDKDNVIYIDFNGDVKPFTLDTIDSFLL